MGASTSRCKDRVAPRLQVLDAFAFARFDAAYKELKSRGLTDLMDSPEGVARLVDLLVAAVRDGLGVECIGEVVEEMRTRLAGTALAYRGIVDWVDAWRERLHDDTISELGGAVVRLLATMVYFETRGTLHWKTLCTRPDWDLSQQLVAVGRLTQELLSTRMICRH